MVNTDYNWQKLKKRKMTFKEFISALFEKWACKHDWERWQTIHVTDDCGGSYHIYHFKCKKCGKVFYTDLSSLIYPNSNITLPVIECIKNLYQIYGAGLHKIRFDLKQQHNIEISHQSIENILLNSNYEFNYKNRSYSGYYLFDSLWVKINGEWNYILALFDVKLNTLVSIKLVDSEDSKTIYQFLNESLRNQKKISIGTDLKHEYREAIDKLNVKHHFCKFHVKQLINRIV